MWVCFKVIFVLQMSLSYASTESNYENQDFKKLSELHHNPITNTVKENEFKFASYYQNHMVLQRAPKPATLWGYGVVGNTVKLDFNDEKIYTTTVIKGPEGNGVWSVTLDPHNIGGPYKIQAMSGNTTISLSDVLYGDVYLCSGQSNMQFAMSQILNSTWELNQTQFYPDVRVFYATLEQSNDALYDLKAINTPWSVPSFDVIKPYSAVCWLYGRYLYDKLKFPIGLVHSAWGGTPVETWMNKKALKECGLEHQGPTMKSPNPQNNSVTWNAMIHPLLNMTIKGVIWYQGEQNAYYHIDSYNCSFPAMIDSWREHWNHGDDFPFGFVQLCARNLPNWFDDGFYSVIRWHQSADYGYAPNHRMKNTYMAVTMDLPDKGIPYNSPHTRDKQDVSKRLSKGALHYIYGDPFTPNGPFPTSIHHSLFGLLRVNYDQDIFVHMTQNFQVCCENDDCNWEDSFSKRTWKNSTIVEVNRNSLGLDLSFCTSGLVNAVRYAWTVTPCSFKNCQVYNEYGLPAAPFYFKVPYHGPK